MIPSGDMETENPPKRLMPDSWTEEEAASYDGRRIRFRKGGEATIKNSVGFVDKDGFVCFYGVQVELDEGGPEIYLAKGDMFKGDFAFDVIETPGLDLAAKPE